ncbi:MAG: RsmB/NOP family class I SAM-dependent RNA methyltransferase [Flavobacteriia bacterium]|nr:RsmB/NOP family class I SAM-dependent RNA methyltransferase [Flavobacteriia bacterium]
MKRYPNLVAGVLEVLEWSFGKGWYADRVVDKVLRANKKWGARDRAFVAQHSYEMVRWWRLLWALLGEEPSLKRKKLKELFELYWAWQVEETLVLPEDLPLGVRESYPAWLDARADAALGAQWPALAHALNQPAQVILRVNTLRSTRERVLERLAAEGIEAEASDVRPEAIVLSKRPRLQHLPSFQEGWYEVQDGGSQCIAPYVDPQPGDRILDGCSGAGGKALHMAALMQNRGEILCMDIEAYKLGEAVKRAQRAGVSILTTKHIVHTADVLERGAWADKMILDVPCSGTGVIRRDVDTKWKLLPEHLERTLEVQARILQRYPGALRVGGRLVYATCSILPEENEAQVEAFVKAQPQFSLEEMVRISPAHAHSDGYFVAVLTKNDHV